MKKILLYIIIAFMLCCGVFGKLIHDKYHEYVRSHKQMYCYDVFRGPQRPVSVIFIKSLKDRDKYLDYYRQLESGVEPYLHVPLKAFAGNDHVYVLEYTKDSLLACVYSYLDLGPAQNNSARGFTKGWVYTKCLHENKWEAPKSNDADLNLNEE